MKRILIFSTAYFPFIGGAEIAVREITNRLSGEFEFDLITAKLKKDLPFKEKIDNVTVFRLGIGVPFVDKLILPFEGAFFARHLEKRNSYTAYWGIMVTFASIAAYIKNIFSTKKVPVILTLQEGDSEKYLKTKWFGLISSSWRFALKRSDKVTVISNYLGKRAKEFGLKSEPVLVPNGVDLKKFSIELSFREREKIRKDLGYSEDDVVLVTTSRLNKKNGIEDVIRAIPQLSDNFKFLIFGVGELEMKLKEVSRSLGVSDRISFRGLVSHNELPKYLKSSDIFIRPSLSEGMGNSFIEAMAAGVPVIATNVGGIPDFLKDGETGLFCEVHNQRRIVAQVKKYTGNLDLKNKIVVNAQRLVHENFDWNKIADQMKQVFLVARE